MQGDAARARDWLDAAQSAGDAADGAAWFPPFVLLAEAAREIARRGLPIALGAQNISAFVDGATTGEISARMVKEAGCAFALVGHSERRTKCGETDSDCAQKITRAREAGIAPILCVGETRDQRDSGATGAVLESQIAAALAGENARAEGEILLFAYEPVWAIGAGETPTAEQIAAAARTIRGAAARAVGESAAKKSRILYGGSVAARNIAAIAAIEGVTGALIGGASLAGPQFAAICRAAAAATQPN